MPTISDSISGYQATVVTGIYIARGEDTLGPYNSVEASALVIGGYLHRDDYAARNGDPAWVPLADFLLPAFSPPAEPAPAPVPSRPAVSATHPHRWRRLAAAFLILLAAPLLIAGGMHWFGHRQVESRATALPPAPKAEISRPPAPTPMTLPSVAAAVLPVVGEVPPPTPVADGPLHGSLAFPLPGGSQIPLAGVRVSAYPLTALEPALDQENAAALAARTRLDPQIETAEAERTRRLAEAQSALQAWRDANPADPLYKSLRFASTGAKTAAKTAEDDYRYLVDERTAAAGGEVYFHGLPEPAVATDTDGQGGFTLALPPGEEPYAVAACARQTADDGTVRSRYWLVQLSPAQRAGRESIRLDEKNVSSAPAPESLIHTAD